MAVIETEEGMHDEYGYLLTSFEAVSIMVFVVEYISRIIVCRQNPKYKNVKYARLRFALTPMMLVDLAVILPFFLPFVIGDARFLRIIRLLRVFRLFKIVRYSRSMQMLSNVFKAKAGDLAVAFFILFIVLIVSSSMMYYVEKDMQPDIFSSIPASMWWGVITLTTIGYGDAYPITVGGKIIGAGIAILGIAVYAMPTGIIVAAFTEEIRKQKQKQKQEQEQEQEQEQGGQKCPHCGKEIG